MVSGRIEVGGDEHGLRLIGREGSESRRGGGGGWRVLRLELEAWWGWGLGSSSSRPHGCVPELAADLAEHPGHPGSHAASVPMLSRNNTSKAP